MKQRIHIFGASGVGTTTLGAAVAQALDCTHFDTDNYFWIETDPPYQQVRDLVERQALLSWDLSNTPSWVLSGSLCGWGDFTLRLVDLVVFLALPQAVRMARLMAREVERYGPEVSNPDHPRHPAHKAFMEWAAAYDDGAPDMRSRAMHEQWMAQLFCPLLRLEGDRPLDENLADVLSAL